MFIIYFYSFIELFRIKPLQTAMTEVSQNSVEAQPPSAASSQLSTRRSRKVITPFQHDIQVLRRLSRKL